MVKSTAETREAHISGLLSERQEAVAVVRDIALNSLPEVCEEGMQHGMIRYYIPLEQYPDTYNKRSLNIITLGSRKNHMALHLMGVYSDPEMELWFKKLEDLPLDVIGEAISSVPPDRFIERYEAARAR